MLLVDGAAGAAGAARAALVAGVEAKVEEKERMFNSINNSL